MELNLSGTKQSDKCVKFIDIFRHLRDFTDFITITLKNDSLYIQGMDNAQVCLYELLLKSEWFNDEENDGSYSVNDEFNNTEVSVNVNFLHSILNIRQEKQSINICYSGEKVCIEFTSEEPKEYDKYFELPTVDIVRQLMEIPDVEYDSDLSLETDTFSKMMSQLKIFDEKVTFNCDDEGVNILATGVDGQMKVNLPVDDLDDYSISDDSELKHTYSLLQVNKMSDFTKVSSTVNISISQEFPMKIAYPLDNNSYIRFFLAPCIDD